MLVGVANADVTKLTNSELQWMSTYYKYKWIITLTIGALSTVCIPMHYIIHGHTISILLTLGACARVTVVVLCVCLSVCLSVKGIVPL